MDTEWIEYQCKSGQTLFIYNKVTGEHKWPMQSSNNISTDIKYCQPIMYKEFCSIATQTDDYDCSNGCTSMYIRTHSTIGSNSFDTCTSEIQPSSSTASTENAYNSMNTLGNNLLKNTVQNEEPTSDLDELSDMLRVLEEFQVESEESTPGSNSESAGSPTGYMNSNSEMVVKEDEDNVEHLVETEITHCASNNEYSDQSKKQHTCSYCKKKFLYKRYLQVHLRIHTGEKPYKCTYCDKHFTHKGNLTTHLRIHTGEKPFQCSYCDKHFVLKFNLTEHLRDHTGEKPYKCTFCDKDFANKRNLRRHLRDHTGEKPFKCTYCDKHFTQKYNLTTHLRVHTGNKPFKCTDCDKHFNLKCNLTRHLRIHAGEKPFKCTDCDKHFTRKCSLTIHLRIHAGEKPFKCTYCDKHYTQKNNLTIHLRRCHTGEKPSILH